ncbi:MAG: hypothetical protein ACP5E4_02920 [Candidatus Aenigmatarchaeota archaeon]
MGVGRKGLISEYIWWIGGAILVLMFVAIWQTMGTNLAASRWGELKVQNMATLVGTISLMQDAPVTSRACVPVYGCSKLVIHKTYIEMWGPQKDYFKEPSYLSQTLPTRLPIYAESRDEGLIVLTNEQDGGFVTTCGSASKPRYICFRKDYVGSNIALIIEGSK